MLTNIAEHMESSAENNSPTGLRGRRVQFRISDVHLPEPAMILTELHGRDLLHGRITDLTDNGRHSEAFAVVEVEGLVRPLIVPTRCLRL